MKVASSSCSWLALAAVLLVAAVVRLLLMTPNLATAGLQTLEQPGAQVQGSRGGNRVKIPLPDQPQMIGGKGVKIPLPDQPQMIEGKGVKIPLPDQPQMIKASYRSVRESVVARWPSVYNSSTLQLPCRDASKAGYIMKNATIGESATLLISRFQAAQYNAIGLPIYVGCQVYISHKWQFIYIRQPKSSSTAVLQEIKDNMCETPSFCTDHELLKTSHIDNIRWKSYFVFTFIRNPWTRLLSAYDMMTHYLFRRAGKGGHTKGQPCKIAFDVFTRDTNNLRKVCRKRGCCPFIAPGPNAGHFTGFVPPFIDVHINDQSHCVFLSDGRALVDFVGRTEHIDKDWPQVLREINARSGTEFEQRRRVQNPNGALGKVEHSCQDAALLQRFDAQTLLNVAKQYSMDLVRYGFV